VVRLHFQERPWDLHLAVAYAIVASVVILALGQGVLWALLLVIFVPGYVLVAALFPAHGATADFVRRAVHGGEDVAPGEDDAAPEDDGDAEGRGKGEIDWIERVALSFGLSIAVVPLLGLLLNFTPWGIRLQPIVVTLLLFTVLVGLAAYGRRMRLPVEERLAATVDVAWPAWRQYSTLDKALTVGLAASVVFAAATLAYVAVTPRPGEQFTQFYILDPNGTADPDLYPTRLNVSEPGTVIVGVVNNESATVNYTIRVDLVGVDIVFNGTSGFNETVERNRTALAWFNVTLADRTTWEAPYTFAIEAPGLWKVQFLLFRDGDLSETYRSLHLFVEVAA
jgi:uncharacterized membrane protein